MSVQMIEKKVMSSDKKHMLYGRVYLPDEKATAFFHVVHGMTEHIKRYDFLMRKMAENGYICFGYDHLGHGESVDSSDELGFIAHENGWDYLCLDVKVFSDAVRKEYGGNLPYYLMGHSMGSFIVRSTIEKYVSADKLIIMGTGGYNPFSGIGLFATRIVKKICGEKYISKTIDKMAFGSFNSHFEGDNEYCWLTKDENMQKLYAADPLCTFKFSVSAMEDLIKLNRFCNRSAWFKNIPKNMPILMLSGKDDPVGDYGRGVGKVYERLIKNGANVRIKLYENCRHEILNDTCRAEVVRDIKSFLKTENRCSDSAE